VLLRTADYLAGVARYGSPAETLAAVRAAPEPVRERADQVLAASIGIILEIAKGPRPSRGCHTVTSATRRGAVGIEVPDGGALMRARAQSGLLIGRFGSAATAGVGFLGARKWEALRLPAGRLARGWRARAPSAGRLEVCALRQA
jgi:hypothetical protein